MDYSLAASPASVLQLPAIWMTLSLYTPSSFSFFLWKIPTFSEIQGLRELL